MVHGDQQEREIRAARNQAAFRAVNEKLRALNEAFAALGDSFAIACECADLTCVQTVDIASADYEAVRAHPRRFVVRHGHVVPEVEIVVRETAAYQVVEKIAAGAEVAELLQLEQR